MAWAVVQGDSLELKDLLDVTVDAVVSDPPYGGGYDTDYTRFTGSSSNKFRPILGDDKPFDPSPWVSYPKVVLFGYQHFANKLPLGTILVWYKKRPQSNGKFLSDCELAWQKGGMGVYLYQQVWGGFDRQGQRGEPTLHPSEKPVSLMRYVINRLKLKPGSVIFDPYAGSGSTGVAAILEGYSFIGCELEEDYCTIARRRCAEAQEEVDRWGVLSSSDSESSDELPVRED